MTGFDDLDGQGLVATLLSRRWRLSAMICPACLNSRTVAVNTFDIALLRPTRGRTVGQFMQARFVRRRSARDRDHLMGWLSDMAAA